MHLSTTQKDKSGENSSLQILKTTLRIQTLKLRYEYMIVHVVLGHEPCPSTYLKPLG